MTIELHNTDKDYYYLVNHIEMMTRATELGYDIPILFQSELDDEDVEKISTTGKSVAIFCFLDGEPSDWITNSLQN